MNTKLLKDCLEFSRKNHEIAKDFFSGMADTLMGKQSQKKLLSKLKHNKTRKYFQNELGYDPSDMQAIYLPMNRILNDIELYGNTDIAYEICLNNLKLLDNIINELSLSGNPCAIWFESGDFPSIATNYSDKIFSDGNITFVVTKNIDLFSVVTANISDAKFVVCSKSGITSIEFNSLLFDGDKLPTASEIRNITPMEEWQDIKKYQKLDDAMSQTGKIKTKYLELKAMLSYVNDIIDEYDISAEESNQDGLFTEDETTLLQNILSGCSEDIIEKEIKKVKVMLVSRH